jgi:hypothetical protein
MSIYDKASLIQIPSGYKAGKLYSVIPNSGAGDFTVTGDAEGDATRVNSQGLIETVNANVPRLDYPFIDGVVQDCPRLLLEPQRTNLASYSQDFDNAYWTKARSSITANQTTSADGSNTADKLIDSTDNNTHIVYRSFTVSTSNAYTFSCFLKKGSLSKAFLAFDAAIGQTVVFDLENGTVESEGTGVTSSSIIEYANDWYKCSLTHTPTTTTRLYRIGTYNGNISYTGTGTDYIYIWGAQIEQGSYPTSYIPTEESAVTRLVDSCHLLNHSLFTDYPFTVYGQAKADAIGNTIFSLVDNTSTTEYLTFQLSSATQVAVIRRNPSTTDADYYNFSYSIGDTLKVAISYISNTSYKLYINGTQIGNVTSGSSLPFAYPDIILGQQRVSLDTGTRNSINEFMVFNEALSDSELQTLTTL